jgi:nucleotide-binding universal stress UspA family protein
VRASPKQSLIVGYDGSEPARRALEHAADLVGRGATLTVINVIAVQSVSARLETVSEHERATQDRLLLEAETLLTRRGIKANLVRAAGDPATEILSAAASRGADVIVVGRRRRTAPHLIHGSLSGTLVRKAASDVLVVH